MLASAVLTPSESKKLIAKAVVALPEMQKAWKEGYIVIHPCSTNLFIYEELMQSRPEGAWVFGYISPNGGARSRDAIRGYELEEKEGIPFKKQWVFYKGKLQDTGSLDEILANMKEGDIFIKGANAIDAQGNVAMLTPNPVKGGTTGKVTKIAPIKGFTIIVPVGLEKMIPGNLTDILDFIGQEKPSDAIGLQCGLVAGKGAVKIDERDALRILAGVEARMGAGGGIDGAEGSVTLFFKGDEDQIKVAMELLRSIKGTTLPKLNR